jgi:hypothetical protein
MKLNISYRPFSGTLMVWDSLNDVLPENSLAEIVLTHVDGDKDNYFVAIGTLDGEFHELQVLDCHGAGQGWNLWVSGYLPDTVIGRVMELVANWYAEYNDNDDLRVKMLAYHRAEVEV